MTARRKKDPRYIPNPRLSRNTSVDPSGNKLLAKIAAIPPMEDPVGDGEIEFRHRVISVEEKFRAELDDEARARLGAMPESGGGAEGKYEPQLVSLGWWVVLDGWPVALRFSTGKPSIEAGDTLALVARIIKA
jgi:hypothetical protein